MDGEDASLLKKVLKDRPGSWEAFESRFAPALEAVCRRILQKSGRPSGPQETADVLQDVFLHLLKDDRKALRDYSGRASLEAYLRAVAACRVLDDRILKSRPENRGEIPLAALPSVESDPAEAMEVAETRELLRTQLDRLPSRTRLALALQGRGASLREIGAALGLTEDAAAQLLSRARTMLKARLQPKS